MGRGLQEQNQPAGVAFTFAPGGGLSLVQDISQSSVLKIIKARYTEKPKTFI